MLLLDLDQANRENFYFRAKLVRPVTERGQVSEVSHQGHLFNFPLSPYPILCFIENKMIFVILSLGVMIIFVLPSYRDMT